MHAHVARRVREARACVLLLLGRGEGVRRRGDAHYRGRRREACAQRVELCTQAADRAQRAGAGVECGDRARGGGAARGGLWVWGWGACAGGGRGGENTHLVLISRLPIQPRERAAHVLLARTGVVRIIAVLVVRVRGVVRVRVELAQVLRRAGALALALQRAEVRLAFALALELELRGVRVQVGIGRVCVGGAVAEHRRSSGAWVCSAPQRCAGYNRIARRSRAFESASKGGERARRLRLPFRAEGRGGRQLPGAASS
ncbi:hypothetical protein BC834DRAFT_861626 [Gloeopeniophorella convolvens]|nr:hypothetical protein BC834DRAFT_861626 [Gloeopeniophorella convolvens]